MSNHSVKLVWVTPDAEKVIGYCARVSNPSNQDNDETYGKLLKYCAKNAHWSIFEQASMCLEIRTSRAIARQILRHKSLSFQEFSTRYAVVSEPPIQNEARRQDTKNRQNSTDDLLPVDRAWFDQAQIDLYDEVMDVYTEALTRGIAKECARVFLPEGLTPSTMYASGTMRSWIHYCQVRCGNGTQKEHQDIAKNIRRILLEQVPALTDIFAT